MFFKAAERSGKLQHLSRVFLTSVLIIAAVAAVFALCACVSDIGTAPISPAPTGNIGIETPDVEPTDIPYEISATYELYYFENRRLEQCVREQLFWEGKIFLGDILSVTKLDLSHCGINDISELAAFKNLVELDLSFNTVQSLEPLTQLKKLKRLTLTERSSLCNHGFNTVFIRCFPANSRYQRQRCFGLIPDFRPFPTYQPVCGQQRDFGSFSDFKSFFAGNTLASRQRYNSCRDAFFAYRFALS